MIELAQDSAAAYATALLGHYGFELGGYTAQELVAMWLHRYRANWVRLAAIEALYQGRYKAVSVDQILATWNRRGRPIYHFNHEFERLISRKIPQNIAASPDAPSVIEGNSYDAASEFSSTPVISENSGVGSTAPTPATTVSPDIAETPANPETNWDWERQELGYEVPADYPPQINVPLNSNFERDNAIYSADWERWEANKRPIHQFMPQGDKSEFYLKLKAVAQHQEVPLKESSTTTSTSLNTVADAAIASVLHSNSSDE